MGASFSWPQLQAFWYVCSSCEKGNHIRVESGEAAVIDIVKVPPPEWEYVERVRDETVSCRSDPGVLHLFIGSECLSLVKKCSAPDVEPWP